VGVRIQDSSSSTISCAILFAHRGSMTVVAAYIDVNGGKFGYCLYTGRLKCAQKLPESSIIIIFQPYVIRGMSNFLNEIESIVP